MLDWLQHIRWLKNVADRRCIQNPFHCILVSKLFVLNWNREFIVGNSFKEWYMLLVLKCIILSISVLIRKNFIENDLSHANIESHLLNEVILITMRIGLQSGSTIEDNKFLLNRVSMCFIAGNYIMVLLWQSDSNSNGCMVILKEIPNSHNLWICRSSMYVVMTVLYSEEP